MKKIDLHSELKALRVPERDQDFWEAFPHRVMTELRNAPETQPVRRTPMPRLAWSLGAALACLAAVLWLGESRTPRMFCYAVVKNGNQLRQNVRLFPVHVRALMQDEHGLRKLVEDQQ